MGKDNCIFCQQSEDIIFETDNFYVKVGIGIIAPGHVMIISRQHLNCFGELPNNLIKEFNELKNKLIKSITETFAEPFLIEYGVGLQSVNHAHIHFIPKKGHGYKINDILKEMVSLEKADLEQVDMKKLKQIYEKEKRYVLIGDKNKLYACHLKHLKDGEKTINLLYRVFFTNVIGLKGIRSWKTMTKKDKKIDEIKRNKTKKLLRIE